ncbi:MAG TPA: hypothetical protein G4O03_07800 [Dehalococcoidia bacterium]|jgi:aldehyde:ferredoxin oxidoreductase|nr:hypothetical protein [Dehalococcoidia bacterium]
MGAKLYGATGKVLRVDLSQGRIWEEVLDEATLRKYFGGTCLGVKYLCDEVDPKSDWSDPQNRLFIGSGPLGGTRVPGSGTISFVTKGALTNAASSTQANGFFGTFLKFCGFDAVLFQGAAPDWKYLYIHNGVAELRDARHLLGQDTWQTEESIKGELGYTERNMSVFSIGPAGENLVKFAGIIGDRGHVAAHNGVGAVMGSKKLKAIAVARGKGKVEVVDDKQLTAIAKQLVESARTEAGVVFHWGTSRAISVAEPAGWLPVKNYTTNAFPEHELFVGDRVRAVFETKSYPCWACPSHHRELMKVTEGPYTGYFGKEPEYEQWAAWGPQIYQKDPGAAVMLSNEVDRLGMDANEASWVVGWVMECYEKGILTQKDLDGLEMTWGNADATLGLLKNIAHRRGFGNLLAEGVKYAAEKVGGEAVNMAICTGKGNTPRGHDHRGKWWEMLDTCVSNTGTLETQLLFLDLGIYGLPKQIDPFSWEQVSAAVAKTKGALQFVDSLVTCWFITRGDLPLLCQAVKAATGWDVDFEEALRVGRRAVNLMRFFSIKRGLTPDLEQPSHRYASTPVDGPVKGRTILPHWQQMISNYYQLMGWDKETGLPLPETLRELGLEHLIAD